MLGKHETSTQTNDLEIRQKNIQTKQSKRTPTDEKAEKHSQKRGKETTKQYNQYKNKKQTRTNTKTERRGSKNTDQTGVEQRRRTTNALLQQTRKTEIRQLRDQHGNTKEKPEEILDIMTDFYEKLHTRESLHLQLQKEILKETKNPKLTETQQKQCDEEYTEKEITEALKNMENDKSPDTDGLTAEFYKKFWPLLTKEFTKMTNAVLNRKCLTDTQREALICCIYKKGDRVDIRNWRPISLLNINYKIITKTITNKIKAILTHLISRYQTACIPQRQIHMNIWYTRDII